MQSVVDDDDADQLRQRTAEVGDAVSCRSEPKNRYGARRGRAPQTGVETSPELCSRTSDKEREARKIESRTHEKAELQSTSCRSAGRWVNHTISCLSIDL